MAVVVSPASSTHVEVADDAVAHYEAQGWKVVEAKKPRTSKPVKK